jgi:hypothetical protein
MWILDRLQGSSSEYNQPTALWVRGRLDRAALHRALRTIADRHQVLRTRFAEIAGEPVQIVDPIGEPAVEVSARCGCDAGSRQAIVRAMLREEWDRPFDLAAGPPFRARVVQLSHDEHIVVRTFHHIAYDRWSHGVFNRELSLLYDAFHAGRGNPLRDLAFQYTDFARWQRATLTDAQIEKGLSYWTQQLAGAPERSDLPTDRPGSARPTHRGGMLRSVLDCDRVEQLKRTCEAHRVTPYMAMLAVLATLLARHSGHPDILIGSPISNRSDDRWEPLIGLFVNLIVLRVQVEPARTFDDLLARVRETTLDAFDHCDVPFEQIVRRLPQRRASRVTPIVQVLFALQNVPWAPIQLADLDVEIMPSPEPKVPFDLEIYASAVDDQIVMSWLFNRDLFDEWRIEQLVRHYERMLMALTTHPHQAVGEADVLGREERLQLLKGWPGRHFLSILSEGAVKSA